MRKSGFFLFLILFFAFFSSVHAQENESRYVIHLLLDGLGKEVFDQALKDGKLPTVQKELVEKGANFAQALTSFPSVSTNNYQSAMSGLFPGSSGLPHLVRYSRPLQRFVDYLRQGEVRNLNSDFINIRSLKDPAETALAPTTIFQLLKERNLPSASVYSTFYLGSSEVYPELLPVRAVFQAFVLQNPVGVDKIVAQSALDLFKRPLHEIPRYSFIAFPGVDLATHHHGVGSSEVMKVLSNFDVFFAQLLARLEKQGIRGQTTILFSADHGAHNTGKVFHLDEVLEDEGVLLKKMNTPSALLALDQRGVSVAQIYFIDKKTPALVQARALPLQNGEKFDLIEKLRSHEEVAFFVLRENAEQYKIFGKMNSEATVQCIEITGMPWCNYISHLATDPLNYRKDLPSLADGKMHSMKEWEQSFSHAYPNVPLQLWQLFQSERSGDGVVVLAPNWGFRLAKPATHGTFMREDLHIPLLAQGPLVPKGNFQVARLVDAFAIAAQALGLQPKLKNDSHLPYQENTTMQLGRELAQLEALLLHQAETANQFIESAYFSSLLPQARAEKDYRQALHAKLEKLLQQNAASLEKKLAFRPKAILLEQQALLKDLLQSNEQQLKRSAQALNILEHCVQAAAANCKVN